MSESRDYRGFRITAQADAGESGFVPSVILAREKSADGSGRKFYPPVEAAFPREDEALRCAMEYGHDLVEGRVEGFDANKML